MHTFSFQINLKMKKCKMISILWKLFHFVALSFHLFHLYIHPVYESLISYGRQVTSFS